MGEIVHKQGSRLLLLLFALGYPKVKSVAKYRKRPRCPPKVNTERQDRLIIQHSRRNRFKTARQIRDDLQGEIGRVSTQTINNRLLAAHLPARRPRQKPELTQQHRQARLQYLRDCSMPGTAVCQGPCSLEHPMLGKTHVDRRKDFVFTQMTAPAEFVTPVDKPLTMTA